MTDQSVLDNSQCDDQQIDCTTGCCRSSQPAALKVFSQSSVSVEIPHNFSKSHKVDQNVHTVIGSFLFCPSCKYSYMSRLQGAFMRLHRRQRQIIVPFIWGILVGIAFTTVVFQHHILFATSVSHISQDIINQGIHVTSLIADENKQFAKDQSWSFKNTVANGNASEKLFKSDTIAGFAEKTRLFVGVITAEKFLSSRALAVNNTWGNQVDKIEFFAQYGTRDKYGIPVINLDNVSDTEYPPQRKAFEMLKYMCAHHIDHFEWFIRADDDVYIRVDKLKKFLMQVDSDRMIYMGQPGHGVPEMRGKLGLNEHNFCMGGPGVIFNRKALKALCPHIDECIAGVVSGEEDVEIGRCVTNHLHIECTHAWDTLKLFYHSYQDEYDEIPFKGLLKENGHVKHALTLHHLKIPYIMYKVHRHYNAIALSDSESSVKALNFEVEKTASQISDLGHNQPIETFTLPARRRSRDTSHWKTFSIESLYSLSPASVARDITNDLLADLKQVCESAVDLALDESRVQQVTFSHVIGGASRSNYFDGTEYFIDVCFQSNQQAKKVTRVDLLRSLRPMQVSAITKHTAADEGKMVVVVPVQPSRLAEFERFLRNFYEPVFLAGGRFSSSYLFVVSIENTMDPDIIRNWSLSPPVEEVLDRYRNKYLGSVFEVVGSFEKRERDPQFLIQLAFARGILHAQKALENAGVSEKEEISVLLTSTNITLSADAISTCKLRTDSKSNKNYVYFNKSDVFNFKARRKKDSNSLRRVYQPVPFRIYPGALVGPWPTAMVPQSAGLKPGLGRVPITMIASDYGFWDEATAAGEKVEVISPLCGALDVFLRPALDALESSSFGRASLNFKKALYARVYGGQLDIIRAPDRSYSSIPAR